jgi:hypothetical protein
MSLAAANFMLVVSEMADGITTAETMAAHTNHFPFTFRPSTRYHATVGKIIATKIPADSAPDDTAAKLIQIVSAKAAGIIHCFILFHQLTLLASSGI